MGKIDELSEQFREKHDKFFDSCDAAEEAGLWNKEEYGEMEAFFQNDLVSVILRLVIIDGNISEKEIRYLNYNFGFDYTKYELAELYKDCMEGIDDISGELFEQGIAVLRSLNEKLADDYKELLTLICDIIIESDGIIDEKEVAEAKRMKALF